VSETTFTDTVNPYNPNNEPGIELLAALQFASEVKAQADVTELRYFLDQGFTADGKHEMEKLRLNLAKTDGEYLEILERQMAANQRIAFLRDIVSAINAKAINVYEASTKEYLFSQLNSLFPVSEEEAAE
jgi:hypothetical protein